MFKFGNTLWPKLDACLHKWKKSGTANTDPYNLQNESPHPTVSLDGMSENVLIQMDIIEHLLDNFRTCVVSSKSGSRVTLAQIKPSRENCDNPHHVSRRTGIIGRIY